MCGGVCERESQFCLNFTLYENILIEKFLEFKFFVKSIKKFNKIPQK